MYYFIIFPLLGGAIGWVTNYLAIKFLFRPRNPWRIGTFRIQGVIPRRRHELAVAVGEVVSRELLPQDQIAAALSTPDIRRNMAELAGETVARRVASFPVLRPFPRALRAAVAQQVAKAVNREVRSLLADEGPEMVNRVLSSVDIAQLVADELNAMDWDYLETIVYAVAGKELKLIEVMGGVLGALIGLIQAVVVYFV